MKNIIPKEEIAHLMWDPNQKVTEPKVENPKNNVSSTFIKNIEELLNGTGFEGDDIATALENALEYAGPEGIILTMPEFIAARTKVEKDHNYWSNYSDVHTEENIGIDYNGLHGKSGEPVLVVVHGGGILTPERIRKAYDEGLIEGSAQYIQEEFSNLLEGKLPDGSTFELSSLDQINKRLTKKPHKFGVVMPYKSAQETESGYHSKDNFLQNPLVIARNGGTSNLEKYFEMAKHTENNNLGNWHVYDSDRDPNRPQGRLLFLGNGNYGLDGSDLDYDGRFIGVAPEARGGGASP